MPDNHSQRQRAVIYARVSSEEQKEGQTIDSQVSELERFAREKGLKIIDVYKDEGWSGTLLARPELDRLRDNAAKDLFDIVLINDVDRLARDVTHLGIIKRDLERKGIQVIFKKLPTENSPTANLMINILGSFAEFEREMILDRMRRGRQHKIEIRKQYLGSNTAYGYKYILKDRLTGKEGYLELHPEEALTVKKIFNWVDTEALSATKVVARLNELNIPPRKQGEGWGKTSVLRILRNEMYTGTWHYNKRIACEALNTKNPNKYKHFKTGRKLRPKAEWIPLELPEDLIIIDREQWKRVQDRINKNRVFSLRNAKHTYLLKALVRCHGCNSRYIGDPCHGDYYYRCNKRCKIYGSIKEHILNTAVWSAIEEAMLTPSIIAQQIPLLQQKEEKKSNELNNEANKISQALFNLKQEEDRILEVYRMAVISPAQLGQEMDKLKKGGLDSKSQKPFLQNRIPS